MTITTRAQLQKALVSDFTRWTFDKASLGNQTLGRPCSTWRATGVPAQGAIPTTTPAVPTRATTGALPLTDQTAPRESYLAELDVACSASNSTGIEIHDRIAHNGGLVLNVTTLQTITGYDLTTLAPSADRVGDANYSDLQWWLEVYTDGGATASNATINVTYHDGTTGNLNVQAVGGTLRVGNMLPLTPLIPAANQGQFIRGVNSVILSASTGTAGNFGFTCTRPRTSLPLPVANENGYADWVRLGFPSLPNDSCLVTVVLPNSGASGTIRGTGKVAQG